MRRKILKILIVLLIVLPLIASTAPTKLAWEAPTTNEDGTPLTDLGGYNIYCGVKSKAVESYPFKKDVGNVLEYPLNQLEPTCKYFSATAYDISGNESVYSNECDRIGPGKPGGCWLK